jgi:hypothetical protein
MKERAHFLMRGFLPLFDAYLVVTTAARYFSRLHLPEVGREARGALRAVRRMPLLGAALRIIAPLIHWRWRRRR